MESAQGSTPHNPDGRPALPEPPADLNRQLALYTLARVGLFVVIALILIVAHVPLVVAPVIAIVVALPLSMLLFRDWSQRVSAGLGRARRATQGDQGRTARPGCAASSPTRTAPTVKARAKTELVRFRLAKSLPNEFGSGCDQRRSM